MDFPPISFCICRQRHLCTLWPEVTEGQKTIFFPQQLIQEPYQWVPDIRRIRIKKWPRGFPDQWQFSLAADCKDLRRERGAIRSARRRGAWGGWTTSVWRRWGGSWGAAGGRWGQPWGPNQLSSLPPQSLKSWEQSSGRKQFCLGAMPNTFTFTESFNLSYLAVLIFNILQF